MTNIERLQWYSEQFDKCTKYYDYCINKINSKSGHHSFIDYPKVGKKWQRMRKFINQRMLTLTEKIWDDLKKESEKLQNF